MVNSQLNDYIAKARQSGLSDNQIKDQLVKTGWTESDVVAALQPPQPITVLNIQPSPAATQTGSTPHSGKKFEKKVVITALIIAGFFTLGGSLFAAYYFNVFPFNLAKGSLQKEEALAGIFGKLQEMSSARYTSTFNVSIEDKEEGALPFSEAVTDFDDLKKSIEMDQNLYREVSKVREALSAQYAQTKSYPSTLRELSSIASIDVNKYQYSQSKDTYKLGATFATEEAAALAKERGTYDSTTRVYGVNEVSGTTVFFTQASQQSTYFNPVIKKPKWIQFLDQQDEYLEYATSDFNLSVTASGSSEVSESGEAPLDAQFEIGGEARLGDLQVAAGAEFLKLGETYYFKLNKFPSVFFDLSAIKEQWVQITPQDLLAGYGDIVDISDYVFKRKDDTTKVLSQLKLIGRSMYEDKVLIPDLRSPDEIVDGKNYYVIPLAFDETKVVGWYEHLLTQLKDEFGDEAILKLDEETLKFMKKPIFLKYLTYIKNNTSLQVVIDPRTGYPVRFETRERLVPSSGERGAIKFKDKQIVLEASLALSAINEHVAINPPSEFLTFEDAQILFTGETKEAFRFRSQLQRVGKIRTAVSQYYKHAGVYPASLEDLKKLRSEVPKVAPSVTPPSNPTGGVYIEFPEDFAEFSYDSSSSINEQSFLKAIPTSIYTGEPFSYKPSEDVGYLLVYSLDVPTRTADEGVSRYGEMVSINEIVKYNDGENTATAQELSIQGKEALAKDTDADELPDAVELYYGTNINNADSDGDGFKDYEEVQKGYDPAGPGTLEYYERWRAPSQSYYPQGEIKSPPPVTDADHVRGAATAAITIIEYADFQCPFCLRLKDPLEQVRTTYGDKVRIVYRHFPLQSIHPQAQKAAEASECAAAQNKFWEMHDALFALNKSQTMSVDAFKKAAAELGLNASQFNKCLDSGTYADRVARDYQAGLALKVSGTPALFINGETSVGALPFETYKAIIDRQLGKPSGFVAQPSSPLCALEGKKPETGVQCCYGMEPVAGICQKAKPDLMIQSVKISPTRLHIEVCNKGRGDSARAEMMTYANGRSNLLYLDGMNAEMCRTMQIAYGSFSLPEKWTGNLKILLDEKKSIDESNESNNEYNQSTSIAQSFGCSSSSEFASEYFYAPPPKEGEPQIVFTRPQINETIKQNQSYIITWETKNFTADRVNIYLDDACYGTSFIARDIKNEGNYVWDAKNVDPISLDASSYAIPPGRYRMSILSTGSNNSVKKNIHGYMNGFITVE